MFFTLDVFGFERRNVLYQKVFWAPLQAGLFVSKIKPHGNAFEAIRILTNKNSIPVFPKMRAFFTAL